MKDYPKDIRGALQALVDAAAEVLPDAPQRVIVQPGANVAWDGCECGQVWVRVPRIQPIWQTGKGGRRGVNCGVIVWAASVRLGTIRCLHPMDDDGNPPYPEDVSADGWDMWGDFLALKGLLFDPGLVDRLPSVELLTPVEWDALGPDGNCAGQEWTLEARLGDCG